MEICSNILRMVEQVKVGETLTDSWLLSHALPHQRTIITKSFTFTQEDSGQESRSAMRGKGRKAEEEKEEQPGR